METRDLVPEPAPGPWLALTGAALVACCLGLTLVGPFSGRPGPALALMLAAGALWLAALVLADRRRPSWALILGVAVAMRVLLLGSTLDLSDDVWRYVWEGGLVAEGRSPYALAPDAPELAAERAAWADVHGRMNNTDISAAYPPVTQAVAAGLTTLAGGPEHADRARLAMALGFTAADLLVLVGLAGLLRRRGLARGRLLVWAWCPLVAWEFAGAAHFDALGLALLVGGLLALEPGPAAVDGGAEPELGPGRSLLGTALLAAAVHVKLLPVLALPFVLLRAARRSARAALLTAASLAVWLALPLAWVASLEGGLTGIGRGLSAYGLRWRAFNLTFDGYADALADWAGIEPRLVVAACMAGLLALLVRRGTEPVAATAAALAGYLLLTPTLHPWYLAWGLVLLPLLPWRLALPWLWLVAVSPLLYLPVVPWQARGEWEVPGWTWAAVGLPTLVLLAIALLSGRAGASDEAPAG